MSKRKSCRLEGMAAFTLQQGPRLYSSEVLQVTLYLSFSWNLTILSFQLSRPFSLYVPLCGTAVPTLPKHKRTMIPNRHWNPAFRKARNWKVNFSNDELNTHFPLPAFESRPAWLWVGQSPNQGWYTAWKGEISWPWFEYWTSTATKLVAHLQAPSNNHDGFRFVKGWKRLA